MNINHSQLRNKFNDFWKEKEHRLIPPINLVPKDDPTTLFTGSGMQQLVPYLLGETHPLGKRLFNIQRCLRAQDIEEVGDNRHETFFEMMGNWSLGDYFKLEQLTWFWQFLTEVLGLPKEKLFVTVFAGFKEISADAEAIRIWQKLGIQNDHIFKYEANWWSRAGSPEKMPAGEPGGPDSEVFYEFTNIIHDQKFGSHCHPNCDCGRFLEIGNSVFMQYKKMPDNSFKPLPKPNVDFGGGLERILAAMNNNPDIFKTDAFWPIVQEIEIASKKTYQGNEKAMRVIADHLKSAAFLGLDGVEPSNKEQGYVMRRLIRRASIKLRELNTPPEKIISSICSQIYAIYSNYFSGQETEKISRLIEKESVSFLKNLDKGIRMLEKSPKIQGELLFNLKQSHGFPLEISLELLSKWNRLEDKKKLIQEYESAAKKHQHLSRNSAQGKFKGGLADDSEQTLKYHTGTHLIHQALFDILGQDIRQTGSNITKERLRFDFYTSQKPTEIQIKKVESVINQKIQNQLKVSYQIIPKDEALKLGAKSFFREKYPDMVKVYLIGNYSKEFCGGPHVKNTGEIGKLNIYKFEKIGANLYRLYAK